MRLAQADILDFSRNPEYQPRKFPDELLAGYQHTASDAAWTPASSGFNLTIGRKCRN